jgi:hypothetical protein
MGNRTIKAPGVEIIEHDLSGYTTTNLGTGCLITGFAQKGEDLEPIQITNRSAWLLNFGAPTNEAEEYFYNAGMEVLNQGGFLYAAKIPYSNDIAGIYAASKFTISKNQELYRQDDDGFFVTDELDENGDYAPALDEEDNPIEPNSAIGRFIRNYKSLKDLGINTLQLIAPTGQDFISKDLVDEYECGESKPNSNVIYLVDKTRAVYTRATEVADKQENRDSRYCIGIVPVISTLCNTAYFQRKSTGVTSDVPELYQPVRSLKTITFPAGAASAAEYKATTFQADDLHTPLMQKENAFATSLSEQAATIAQSCLANGNLVDGKLKPFVANDVAVVVFKAFVSTEDGKIEFSPVETFVGSLDPNGRNEKGLTTFIDTIVNNNSEYIYCFSNLANPEQVLNPDHGFVAGSDSEFEKVKSEIVGDLEYDAASLFSAYAARMLGFGDNLFDDSEEIAGLAAPRYFPDEVHGNGDPDMDALSTQTMSSLRKFYNEDAKKRICVLDALVYGGKLNEDALKNLVKFTATSENMDKYITGLTDKYLNVIDKYITEEPTIKYLIQRASKDRLGNEIPQIDGQFTFKLSKLPDDPKANGKKYDPEQYEYEFKLGQLPEDMQQDWRAVISAIGGMELSELSILNSTDYLRAIYDFDELVDPAALEEATHAGFDPVAPDYDSVEWAKARQMAIQALIINSMEKSGKFKLKLRYLKKAQANVDKLDDALIDYNGDDAAKSLVGKKYIEDLYKSYDDLGIFSGIGFVNVEKGGSDSSTSAGTNIETKKDALEAKLDAIVNIDTTKKEKMKSRAGTKPTDEDEDLVLLKKYVQMRMYLTAQLYAKRSEMLSTIAKVMEDCCYAQQRYIESKRNIDDASIMLGFYPEMAEPIITYTTIAQSLNKIFDEMGDIHRSDIDVVCDAGISNIAQFVKQVYDPSADDGEDVGGIYNPVKYASYFKFNKNTDLAYWKTIVFKFDTFCKFRGDCMFVTESPRNMVLIGNKQVVRKTKKDTNVDLNILPYLSKIAGFNTSYGAGYLNWYRTISDYTGDTLWVPPSIKAMGTYILTDKQYNWWDAPAGMRRGVINMVETSFNPNRVQAGEIYDVNWNYAIHYLNDGIIQEGQKTFQTRQSALDRVNVRRLIGRIKRYVYFASRQFLYEPHTQAIREKYVKYITPFFQDLMSRGGLYDFKIICDSTNNTPEVIDRNELRVKIGIKPVKTIEFIIIDLCVLNTGASWTEMDAV